MLLLSIFLGISTDCRNIINLAIGLNLNTVLPEKMHILDQDCCNFVDCNNGRVVQINWSYIGLNGTINGTAIPDTVQYLKMEFNSISGTLPELPQDLLILNLWNNDVTGTLPVSLPPTLVQLYLPGNRMHGVVPQIPDSLTVLVLGGGKNMNKFTGSVYMKSPEWVNLSGTMIAYLEMQTIGGLYSCDISFTPMLRIINDQKLSKCIRNGLFNESTSISSVLAIKTADTFSSTSGKYLDSPTTNQAQTSKTPLTDNSVTPFTTYSLSSKSKYIITKLEPYTYATSISSITTQGEYLTKISTRIKESTQVACSTGFKKSSTSTKEFKIYTTRTDITQHKLGTLISKETKNSKSRGFTAKEKTKNKLIKFIPSKSSESLMKTTILVKKSELLEMSSRSKSQSAEFLTIAAILLLC
eukprot:NODE_243_length_13055_cov_0.283498.p3 type:complete len:413 gc:universal NODE_243_length_13055_cov_0.283498:7841-9079(+)